jgi:general secretion pathway protein F
VPRFHYEAVAASGSLIAGEMEAPDRNELLARLQRTGHVPLRAEAAAPAAATSGRRLAAAERWKPRAASNRVALAQTTQQLAVLLGAGLSLDRALDIAATTSPNTREADALGGVVQRVRGGASLADALATEPTTFPRFYVGIVRAGEAGATLDATLRDLAGLLERAAALREQIISALIYPSLVLATCAASLGLLFLFVIPRFRPILDQSGGALPPFAAAVFAIADFARGWWWAMLVAAGVVGFVFARALGDPVRRLQVDRMILRLPLIGDIVRKIETGRFAYTLGTLLRNGVAPLPALAIAREGIGNVAVATALGAVSDRLSEGKGWADPIAQAQVLPALAIQLIRVGEETARLEQMLTKIGEIYDAETRRSIERLLALLVPGITILLGLVVAAAIGSIFSAILSVYEFAL